MSNETYLLTSVHKCDNGDISIPKGFISKENLYKFQMAVGDYNRALREKGYDYMYVITCLEEVTLDNLAEEYKHFS